MSPTSVHEPEGRVAYLPKRLSASGVTRDTDIRGSIVRLPQHLPGAGTGSPGRPRPKIKRGHPGGESWAYWGHHVIIEGCCTYKACEERALFCLRFFRQAVSNLITAVTSLHSFSGFVKKNSNFSSFGHDFVLLVIPGPGPVPGC